MGSDCEGCGSRFRWRGIGLAVVTCCACVTLVAWAAPATAAVLTVGKFSGKDGKFKSIQTAIDKAHPGDWVLIGPGDYKEAGTRAASGAAGDAGAAVLLEKSGVHIRGMDRNGVLLDGTKPGTPRCSAGATDQNLGPLDAEHHATGRNGLEVFKAQGVSVENLSACNFLTGSGGGG